MEGGGVGAVIADHKSHRRIINGACRVDQTTTIIISWLLFPPSIHPSQLNWPTRIPSIPSQGETSIDDPLGVVASRRRSWRMTRSSGDVCRDRVLYLRVTFCKMIPVELTWLVTKETHGSALETYRASKNIKTIRQQGNGDDDERSACRYASAQSKSLETLITRTAAPNRPDYFPPFAYGKYLFPFVQMTPY
jgi:hypothetical protein